MTRHPWKTGPTSGGIHSRHHVPKGRSAWRWTTLAVLVAPPVLASAAVLPVPVGASPSRAQVSVPGDPVSSDSIRAILHERIAREGGVGLVAGLVTSTTRELHTAGEADATVPGPLEGSTVFEIGSLAKVLTGMLLAEMVVSGEVGLEDPVAHHLPDSVRVPAFDGTEITLLDLATHTSGLPRLPGNLEPVDPRDPYRGYGATDLYEELAHLALARRPGASFEYSNLGMGLLGQALAHRGGRPYEALVRERILEPLGMADTRITLTPALRSRLASGHGPDLESVPNWDMGALGPAGGWHSTGEDLLRFVEAILDPRDEAWAEVVALALKPRRNADGPGSRIGLGWQVQATETGDLAWHNGITGGYYAFLGLDRAAGRGSLVLANTRLGIEDIGFHLVDGSAPVRHPPEVQAAVPVDEGVLEGYVGRYRVTEAFEIEVLREGDTIYVQATEQPRFRARATSPTRFVVPAVEAEIEFTVDADGSVTGLVLHQGGVATPAERIG